jgi:Ca2+-transporting ATPase
MAGSLIRERSFDSERKTRSTIRVSDDETKLFVSGAPEGILTLTKDDSSPFEEALRTETAKGRRVIGIATKTLAREERDIPFEELEKELRLVGLLFLEDPPRKEVKETIERLHSAGIHTVMVTGDHPLTARFVAQSVGIGGERMMTGDGNVKLFLGVQKRTNEDNRNR